MTTCRRGVAISSRGGGGVDLRGTPDAFTTHRKRTTCGPMTGWRSRGVQIAAIPMRQPYAPPANTYPRRTGPAHQGDPVIGQPPGPRAGLVRVHGLSPVRGHRRRPLIDVR